MNFEFNRIAIDFCAILKPQASVSPSKKLGYRFTYSCSPSVLLILSEAVLLFKKTDCATYITVQSVLLITRL